MSAYLPRSTAVVLALTLLLTVVALGGFALTRPRPRGIVTFAAWLLTFAAFVTADWIAAGEPPGVRMTAVIVATLLGLKAVVGVASRAAGDAGLSARAWFAFALGWFGMRPAAFATVPGAARDGAAALVALGMRRLLAGGALIAAARVLWVVSSPWWSEPSRRLSITLLLLPGLSLVLHFGILNVSAGWWRYCGADARTLFRAPALATSLGEFWGRRWNLAFSEMAALAVFRPLRRLCGNGPATAAAFLVSGLLHELALSVPVRAGYGLPMLYFALHAGAMVAERRLRTSGRPLDGTPLGRLWTAAWVLLPLPLLFHVPFLRGCVWPLIGAG